MPGSRYLNVRILGDAADLEKALNKSAGATDKAGSKFLSMGKKAALGAGAAGVGAIVVGLKGAVEAAHESEKAQARLQGALKSVGVSYADHGKEIDAAIQKTSRLAALDDEDLSDAYAKLIVVTKDAAKATQDMNLAADIARARNISLEAATRMVEKAEAGSATAFKRVGIVIPQVTTHVDALKDAHNALKDKLKTADDATKASIQTQLDAIDAHMKGARELDKAASAQNAIAAAQKTYGAAAEAYGKTSAAESERFHVAIENLKELIGSKILPVVGKLLDAFTKAINYVSDNWGKVDAVFKTFQGVIEAVFDKIRPIFDGVLEQIRGWVKIIDGIIHGDFSKVWAGIKQVVSGVFHALEAQVKLAWDLISSAMATLAGKAVNAFKDVFQGIANFVGEKLGTARDVITGAVTGWYNAATGLAGRVVGGIRDGLVGAHDAVAAKIRAIPGAITGAASDVYNAAKGWAGRIVSGIGDGLAAIAGLVVKYLKVPINAVIRAINAVEIPSKRIGFSIPVGFGKHVGVSFDTPNLDPFPDIPYLAQGGIVTRPTVAMIGEAGPEAVVPLRGAGGLLGGTLSLEVPVMLDGREIARASRRAALSELRSLVPNTVTGKGAYGLA